MKILKQAKKIFVLNLVIAIITIWAGDLCAQTQRGYYDAPYTRYEANVGVLVSAAATTQSFNQWNLQSEASEQVCVNMSNSGASVQWTVSADGDGLVVRYSVPDGQSGILEVYANGVFVGTMNLSSYYSWESLWNNGNSNNGGVSNQAPKMRFDEVRMKLPSKIIVGQTLRLVRQSGNIHLDFAELESVPAAIPAAGGNVVYGGNGSDLQAFINVNGGATIYVPAGVYNVNNTLYFGNNNTSLRGAGMWYTQINFTNGNTDQGGLWANADNISYSDLYLTTVRNSRSSSYKSINGAYIAGSTITRVWSEHFECGAWIADYNPGGPDHTDGLVMSYCRFRNNYADGTNLCKGTLNAIVEHCNYRNNGDDDMAVWPANSVECRNNTFRYNTSENCWRASGCAIYGGYNNQAHHLLIQDNVEVGIKVNNAFGGSPFNGAGMHVFSDITIKRCGTYYDLFNTPVGAIDIGSYDYGAGTRVQNVKFSCIDIIDSKNDAIFMKKATSGSDGLYNIVFENITIDGTGREYPDNGGAVGGRGYDVLFKGFPNGNGTYCGMTYLNRGGSAGSNENLAEKGSGSNWNAAGSCPSGCVPPSSALVTITSPANGTSFAGCPVAPVTITATATPPSGNTVQYLEFFVDGASIGTDNSSPYSIVWNSPTDGSHTITAVAHYTPSNTTTTSAATSISVGGVRLTSSAPVIDGAIDPLWTNYPVNNLTQGYLSPPDLAAYYKMTYDATNLYILVDVTDDVLVRNGTGGTWEDDGVEIYIDMGNDKANTYGANDYQFSLNWNSGVVVETKHNSITGVTLAQANRAGGYIMEVRIPWSTLGTAPTGGTLMGFDIKVNDDDDGGTRDHELGWKDPTFNAWNNPSLFGTVQFSNCGPLPVTLLSFVGVRVNETVVLSWATTSETNNQKFIVERSADLNYWKPVDEIAGMANSASLINYSSVDYEPLLDVAYYRLKQRDLNGNFVYSDVVVVHTKIQALQITISPNPFDDVLSIQSNVLGAVEILIQDILGSTVYRASEENLTGLINVRPALVSGTYIITISSNTFIEQRKIVKQ